MSEDQAVPRKKLFTGEAPKATAHSLMMQQFGKLPPQAQEIEIVVLGAIMLEKGILEEVLRLLQPEMFYRDAHQKIFAACLSLHNSNEPVDIMTVINKLKETGELDMVGGPFYVSTLTNQVASSANTMFHAGIIAQKFISRELIRVCSENTAAAFDDSNDPFALLESMDVSLTAIKEKVIGRSGSDKDWSSQLTEVVGVIEKLKFSDIKVTGIPTGSHKLDSVTGGWQKGNLIILSGRPGSGKSTRALNFIKAATKFGHPSVMFSLEMDYREITRKFINEETEIYGQRLVSGDINDLQLDLLHKGKNKLIKLPFHLNDKAAINTNYVRNTLRAVKKKMGDIGFCVIDYLQIMKSVESMRNRSRDNELGTITGALKTIAKEFDIPMLVLSQLSRKCEERSDKRPILSDLRESGSIENDADMVLGLYRPEYYHKFENPFDTRYKKKIEEGMSKEEYDRVAELSILKHRNGESGIFMTELFDGKFSRFTPSNPEVATAGEQMSIPVNDHSIFARERNPEPDADESLPF